MLDLAFLDSADPIDDPFWTAFARHVGHRFWGIPGVDFVVEGLEHLPRGPAIISPNHTHSLDALPLRYILLEREEARLVTWVKARVFKDPLQTWFFTVTGCVPLASRGYIIAADAQALWRRRPTGEEYRAMRDNVDAGAPLPQGEDWDQLQGEARDILGAPFDPSASTWREAVLSVYRAMMTRTLELARVVRDAGHHQNIYPQGATAQQLTPGRIGTVQAALALDVPVVPVGISGCPQMYFRKVPLPRPGSRLEIRFGEPLRVPSDLVPENFEPFHPEHEGAHKEALEGWTQRLMERINRLIAPQHQWAEDEWSDAKRGVKRFY